MANKKQKLIGDKISSLIRDENVPHEQAIAIALSMYKAGRLRPDGKYVPVKESFAKERLRPTSSDSKYHENFFNLIDKVLQEKHVLLPHVLPNNKMRQGLRSIYAGGHLIGGYVITPLAIVTYDSDGNEVSRLDRGLVDRL